MKSKLIQIFVITAILALCGPAYSTVLVVDPAGGGDFLTFEEAVAEVVAGDTIEFVDGIHNVDSQLRITTPDLILKSESGNPNSCTITGRSLIVIPEDDVEFDIEIHDLGLALISRFVRCGVLISGCRLLSPGLDEGMSIDNLVSPVIIENTYFENMRLTVYGRGITLRSCQVVDSRFYSINILGSFVMEESSFTGSSVVQIHGAENIVIDRCNFFENETDVLLEVSAFSDISITSCMFSGNQLEEGFALLVAGETPTTNINIEDSSFRNNTSSGLGVWVAHSDGPPTSVFCENVDFVGNSAPNGSPDAFVRAGCELYLNCCEIDESNIGGDGDFFITNDGCTVSTDARSWGDLKAMFR